MRRATAAVVVALLTLIVAVTPLEAIVRPGHFELTTPAMFVGGPPVEAVLDDRTGLVSGLLLADANPGLTPSNRILVAPWEGDTCGDVVSMELWMNGNRYTLSRRTASPSCSIGSGLDLHFALILRAPIDPTQFVVIDVRPNAVDSHARRRGPNHRA